MPNHGSSLAESLRGAGFRGVVLENEPMAPYTTWRIGGPADALATPADADDLVLAIGWARNEGETWRILGNGSNLLVLDDGVRGLVLRLRRTLDSVTFDGERVTAGAGASFPGLANQAAARGLAGLEYAAGIPGTVGGAIIMNAGWHEYEIGNTVDEVEILTPEGETGRRDRGVCGFGYRTSRFRGGEDVILSARLRLQEGDPEAIRSRMEAFAESRKKNQPTHLPSCGSVFLKPPGDYAGRLIDQAGLKGLRIGGIEVSRQHANFFVNLGGGTARDVLELAERVENEVRRRFGVELVREFEVWE